MDVRGLFGALSRFRCWITVQIGWFFAPARTPPRPRSKSIKSEVALRIAVLPSVARPVCLIRSRQTPRARHPKYALHPEQTKQEAVAVVDIRERTGAGRERAMAAGVKFGRKRKLSDYQRTEAIKRRDAGETLAAVAKSYGVSLAMISRL
jgi:hypothetical protein